MELILQGCVTHGYLRAAMWEKCFTLSIFNIHSFHYADLEARDREPLAGGQM